MTGIKLPVLELAASSEVYLVEFAVKDGVNLDRRKAPVTPILVAPQCRPDEECRPEPERRSDTRNHDIVRRRRRRGNANDQACGRDDAIVGPEHRCSQPPDATDEVVLRVQAQTTHPTFAV